jgi:hypothetical protein
MIPGVITMNCLVCFQIWMTRSRGLVQSTIKSSRTCDLIELLDSKTILYSENLVVHLPILVVASRLLNRSLRLRSVGTLILCASK